ncbi:MAG TPA: hypothetical protein VE573_04950 [Nitrososphaeraceae archaeon]|jgi:hypothetical protein|nr:hypothetical protein [Nitrososphaeraceae archaeon]
MNPDAIGYEQGENGYYTDYDRAVWRTIASVEYNPKWSNYKFAEAMLSSQDRTKLLGAFIWVGSGLLVYMTP